MAIKKLNKFFHDHSRVIFGVFAVLIILAFMPVTGNIGGGCDDPRNEVVGTAFGEDVTVGDLQELNTKFFNYGLLIGQNISQLDPSMLFEYYCIMLRAEQLGIHISDEEVAEVIARSPVFLVDGKFSQEAYNTFLQNHNLTDEDVESAIRAVALPGKLNQLFLDSVVVTEDEARNFYAAMYGELDDNLARFIEMYMRTDPGFLRMYKTGFELDLCSFTIANYEVEEPTAEELQAYYDAHKGDFMTPGSVETVAAIVPFARFLEEAAASVTAEEIAAAKPNMPGKSDDEIKAELAIGKARVLAGAEANRLGGLLANELDASKSGAEQIRFFREWAANNGLTVEESGVVPFDGTELNRRLQTMPLTGSRLVAASDTSSNGVRIIMLKDRVEPQQMSFEAASALVAEACKAAKKAEKAREVITAEIQRIKALPAEEQAAAFAAFANGTHSTLTLPLDQGALFQNMSLLQLGLSQWVITMSAGEISDILPFGDQFLVVRVVSRTPVDMSTFEAAKDEVIEQLRAMKAQVLMEEFMAEVKQQCHFTYGSDVAEDAPAE